MASISKTVKRSDPRRIDPTKTIKLRRAHARKLSSAFDGLKVAVIKEIESGRYQVKDAVANASRSALEEADFVRLPKGVPGTNCSNCRFQHDGDCDHPKLRPLKVTERDCCAYWDAVGTKRPWSELAENWSGPCGTTRDGGVRLGNDTVEVLAGSLLNLNESHKYGCAFFQLPKSLFSKIKAKIDPADVIKWSEDFPHVTVRYGLHTDDPHEVAEALGSGEPVSVGFGPVSVFSNDEDVLKVEVRGDALHSLHESLGKLEHTDTHDGYQPHVTIAYLKPGTGAKYAGASGLEGWEVFCNTVRYSSRDGSVGDIRLGPIGQVPWAYAVTKITSNVWTDEAREAALEARRAKSAGPRDGAEHLDRQAAELQSKASRVTTYLSKYPRQIAAKISEKVSQRYEQLSQRYGPRYAKVIVATALAGLPVPVPGASLLAAAPVIMTAELHKRFSSFRAKSLAVANAQDSMTGQEIREAANLLLRDLRDDALLMGLDPSPVKNTMEEEVKRTVALDFDGVIQADKEDWDKPEKWTLRDGAREMIEEFAREGVRVVVSTANLHLEAIKKWLRERGLEVADVVKKVDAVAYVDDRGVEAGEDRDLREVTREALEKVLAANAFCPTGEGGGVDPSCSPEKSSGGWGEIPKWQQESLKNQASSLTEEDRGTVSDYQETGLYDPMNNYLRTGKLAPTGELGKDIEDQLFAGGFDEPESKGYMDQQVKAMDKVLSKTVLHGDITVYRGIEAGRLNLKVGQVLEDKGFMSTTIDKNVAKGFSKEGGTLLKIKARHGLNALYSDSIVDLGQKEVIFPRGSKIKISAIRKEGNTKVIHAVMVTNSRLDIMAANASQPVPADAGYDAILESASANSDAFEDLLSKLSFPIVYTSDLKVGDLEVRVKREPNVVVIPPPKSERRATEKVESDYGGDWSRLTDVLRASVVCGSLTYLRETAARFEKIVSEAGGSLAVTDDTLDSPHESGYRSLRCVYRLPSGFLVEVIWITTEMFIAYERNHSSYDAVRAIKLLQQAEDREDLTEGEKEAVRRIEDASRKLYEEAWGQTRNAFCPTGEGGGVDPSCSKSSKKIVLYHETPSKNVEVIAKQGLKSNVPSPKWYTLTDSLKGAREYSSGASDRHVLEFHLTPEEFKEHIWKNPGASEHFGNQYALKKPLKPSMLKAVHVSGEDGESLTRVVRNSFAVQNAENFPTSQAAAKAFLAWLKKEFKKRIRSKDQDKYWQSYIEQGFKKGQARAFDDTNKKHKALAQHSKEKLDFYEGTRAQFLKSSFGKPVSVAKVKRLASRCFEYLDGVDKDMAKTMKRVLMDGLVQGTGPRELARKLAKQVDIGKNRALLISRTELIKAHADGQLDTFKEQGVEELGVAVEWAISGSDNVCPLCQALDGVVLKIDEAEGLIPRHPGCVCCFMPWLGDEGPAPSYLATKRQLEEGELDDVDIDKKRPKSPIFNQRVPFYPWETIKSRVYNATTLPKSELIDWNSLPDIGDPISYLDLDTRNSQAGELYDLLYGPNRTTNPERRKRLQEELEEILEGQDLIVESLGLPTDKTNQEQLDGKGA